MTKPGQPEQRTVILCVEDEADLRRDIVDELGEAGYAVVQARNGEEALQLLDAIRPDLILCDISMPGLNGFDVLRTAQAKGTDYSAIPFVFLSALADPREVVAGKRLGADDYLVKPIDYDLLLATVEARLRQVTRIKSSRRSVRNGIDEDELYTSWQLTPTEARVTKALSMGKTLSQIAADFDISRTTVAFHMRNVFQKTGTTRQAELVARVLSPDDTLDQKDTNAADPSSHVSQQPAEAAIGIFSRRGNARTRR
jgi:DNA-binding NarL/FixJ family response regulator